MEDSQTNIDFVELLRGDIGVLEEKISKYFSTFKQEDFFTFANRKERKNFYKKAGLPDFPTAPYKEERKRRSFVSPGRRIPPGP